MRKSIRNFLKRKSKEPRKMEEIQQNYAQLLNALGQAQYLTDVHAKEAKRLSGELELINREGAERQKLDQEAKQAAPVEAKPVEEAKNA